MNVVAKVKYLVNPDGMALPPMLDFYINGVPVSISGYRDAVEVTREQWFDLVMHGRCTFDNSVLHGVNHFLDPFYGVRDANGNLVAGVERLGVVIQD
ncbi:MAG: hypothetical protein RML84_09195 [Anaerolineae bacterium]|nr:hypothetical protein [Anaerolineae bacterium]